ncbi:MAG: D-aminoacyl-tRNA deacylase [Gammaproteobacteria bacterium]|nr:D-aminoacyl-tRNA deacylase [Gammaproteobacteria bacterium]MDH3534366.1 D-aminoacyl-tRNA deacylase [Gammaproteobacteria bacterium]
MITLLQRVSSARVEVEAVTIGSIDQGILVLVGVEADDDESTARRFVERLLDYRVFADADGKMNLSLRDIDGGLLLVPQFTLAANTRKGRRPSFASAANPQHGRDIFVAMTAYAGTVHDRVECGHFGADMQVHLVNNGPVTFILD